MLVDRPETLKSIGDSVLLSMALVTVVMNVSMSVLDVRVPEEIILNPQLTSVSQVGLQASQLGWMD